jgi:hypothetical protein
MPAACLAESLGQHGWLGIKKYNLAIYRFRERRNDRYDLL